MLIITSFNVVPWHSKMSICSNKYLPWGTNNLHWADTIDELWRCVQTVVDYMQQKALKNREESWKIKIHYSTEVITLSYTFNNTFCLPRDYSAASSKRKTAGEREHHFGNWICYCETLYESCPGPDIFLLLSIHRLNNVKNNLVS